MKPRSGRQITRRKNMLNFAFFCIKNFFCSFLPTEVWVDVFCYLWVTISRPELARMVDKIGNRWFGEQLQFYLHEWGKHTLAKLLFIQVNMEK